MKDEHRTKQQLLNELAELRQRVAELEAVETERLSAEQASKRAEEALRRSLEETARSQRLLLALSQAAQAVQLARTPAEVYRTVGQEVTGLGYHAIILTLTDDRAHLTITYLTYELALLQAVEKLTGIPTPGYRFPLLPGGLYQQTIAGKRAIFNERSVEWIAEALPEMLRPLADRLAAMLGVEQSICAPLIVGGETHGLLAISGASLTEADAPAVTILAHQAAIAIEKARLLDAITKQRRDLQKLSTQLIGAQEAERKRISQELHDEMGQALTVMSINLAAIEKESRWR